MKPFFTPEDFDKPLYNDQCVMASAIASANAKLEREAAVMYGYEQSGHWYYRSNSDMTGQTHTAMLINIRPIEKKCVKHEPTVFDGHIVSIPFSNCKHCGVELVAKWTEKGSEKNG
jgi:hypothetical protein